MRTGCGKIGSFERRGTLWDVPLKGKAEAEPVVRGAVTLQRVDEISSRRFFILREKQKSISQIKREIPPMMKNTKGFIKNASPAHLRS